MTTRKDLEQRVDVLQARLRDLEQRPANETERPIREVGIDAIKDSLAQVGRLLTRCYP